MRTTPIKIVNYRGGVEIRGGQEGYSLKGNDEAVCFMVDVSEKVDVLASGSDSEDIPHLCLCGCDTDSETVISFPEFKGWRVHSAKGGKNLSVALTNDFVDLI